MKIKEISKKIKKQSIVLLLIGLVAGSTMGVYAADNLSRLRSHGILNYNNGDVVVDGDAIGYWINGTDGNALATITGAQKTITIRDANLTPSSVVDIYYAEEDKAAVSKMNVSYTQGDGTLTITFAKALSEVTVKDSAGNSVKPTEVKVMNMHIINPKTSTAADTSATAS